MSEALHSQRALRLQVAGERTVDSRFVDESIAEETAVALLFNGVPHVVMMCSPIDLDDFAIGFALSEGIVERADEVEIIEMISREEGIAVHLAIPGPRFEALAQRQRQLVGRSGCGLCGAETLAEAMRPVRRLQDPPTVAPLRLSRALQQLTRAQPLNARCGGLHAAAALLDDGLLVREDVGRHNALDKVLGALTRSGKRCDAVLVTSRASYELVHKAAQCGIGTLVAVSAPTALAVRLAEQAGLCLYGFAREGRLTRYSAP